MENEQKMPTVKNMDPKDRWKLFGAWLRKERETARRSQKEVASLTGLHPVHVSRIETGDTGIKLKTLDALIKALGLDPEEAYRQAGFWPAGSPSSPRVASEDSTFGEKMEALIASLNAFSHPAGNRHKRRPQVIGLTARLLAEFRRLWKESDGDPERRIFGAWLVRRDGEGNEVRVWHPIRDFKRAYSTALEIAGVTDLRFTDWRHAFATDLAEADVPRQLAMKISGHTQESTHDIYTNIDARLARSAASALDRLHASRTTRSSVGGEPNEPASGFVN